MKRETFLYEYVELLRAEDLLDSEPSKELGYETVRHLTFDSRTCVPGTLFVCKGEGFKPEYLEKAFEAGAFCYVSEVRYAGGKPAVIVSDIRRAMALMAELFYGTEERSFKLVGLTVEAHNADETLRRVTDEEIQKMVDFASEFWMGVEAAPAE